MTVRDQPLESRASISEILRGRARLVGARTQIARDDLGLTPGMISPYEVRLALGLRYGDPPIEEARYERDRTTAKDLSLLLRFALSRLMNSDHAAPGIQNPKPWIVSAFVDGIDTSEAIESILGYLKNKSSALVFFVHPHALNLASKDESLKQVIAKADLILPDGVGIRLAASILGIKLAANVNGTDLIPELLVQLAADKIPIALIGGKPGIAEAAARAWSKKTEVKVIGAWDGFLSTSEYDKIAEYLEKASPCVLLVGLGSPLQERFALSHFAGKSGLVTITVGGLFDFAADAVPRAPLAWRELGFEWLWRLVHEPKRLAKRYLVGNPAFVLRVVAQRLRQTTPRQNE